MTVVDIHAHVIVPEITRVSDPADVWRPQVSWEEGRQVIEFGGQKIRSAVREFVRVDRILEEEAGSGVDHVLLSPWVQLLPYDLPLDRAVELCRIQNQGLAEIVRQYPARVTAMGAVPLQHPDSGARELEKAMGLPGIRGVEVAASVEGVYLGDDRFTPFWEAAEGTGAVVFVHPTTRGFDLPVFSDYYLWNSVGNPMETAVTAAHMVMSGVMERHQDLRVILSHAGGGLMSVRGRLRHAHGFQPQARARLLDSPDHSLRRFFYDTLAHDEGVLRGLIEYAGVERVLLGSDHPFDMGTQSPVEEVRALDLTEDEEEALLGLNAARLLGLAGTGATEEGR